MTFKNSRFFLINTCAVLTLLTAGCTVPSPTSDIKTADSTTITTPKLASKTIQLDFKKGQVLSFIVIDGKKGEEAVKAREKYYKTAFPLSSQFGLSRDIGFNVVAVPVGKFKPEIAILFSWPSAEAERRFNAHPDWPAIKATRPDAWDELRVYNDVFKQDISLTFDTAKTYTLAAAWINPKHPNDYEKYLSGIQEAVTVSGGQFIYIMHNPTFEAHAAPQGAPDKILMVEWDTPDGLQKFGQSAGFKANAKYLGSGTKLFELSVLTPTID